jgi:hypothetical protein
MDGQEFRRCPVQLLYALEMAEELDNLADFQEAGPRQALAV